MSARYESIFAGKSYQTAAHLSRVKSLGGAGMKKVVKIVGLILLAVIVVVIAGFQVIGRLPSPAAGYQKKLETGGVIEAEYLKSGPYETAYYEEKAMQVFEKYEIFYPAGLADQTGKYPVIVVCNGTGWKASKSKTVYERYASWGFIVIASEEAYSWNAFGAEMAIRHLERLNDNKIIDEKENIFYQKIDFDNVGIIGHSQGGVGVFNAITNTEHKDVYKAAIALSPTNKALAQALEWPYDAMKTDVPIMLVSGEGGGDDWVVTLEGLTEIYDDIRSQKVMLRRKNTPHGETQYSEDGYVTAWFMWHLQGDQNAAKAFVGDQAELLTNPLYQDQRIDMG